MIRSACFAAAALLATCLPFPVAAQNSPDSHHSASQRVILADWIARVENELGRQLAAQRISGRDTDTGVVRIKFNCSDDGRTDKVSVARSSGSSVLDVAATRVVKRIAVMHPLATGINTDQIYYADIMFTSGDDQSYRRQMTAMRDAALKNNGWFKPPEDPVIASR